MEKYFRQMSGESRSERNIIADLGGYHAIHKMKWNIGEGIM